MRQEEKVSGSGEKIKDSDTQLFDHSFFNFPSL